MSHVVATPHTAQSTGSWNRDREVILARYLDLLEQAQSPLLGANDQALQQIRAQLYGVIDAVATTIGLDADPGIDTTTESAARLSEAIGRSRATAGIHPSQSLQAAALIFEAALPTIASRLAATGDPSSEITAGQLLNREILHRMAAAARTYVDYLLEKAQSSNRDERRRLSRELHDVAAPAVAIGLQNLELFELYTVSDPARAALKIQAARQSLLDALSTIRSLSAQARENAATSGLEEAIRRYLDTVPTDIRTEVTADGDFGRISRAYAEELFLIIREAVRNAVEHGNPRHIKIHVTTGACELHAEITDDGNGFDIEQVLSTARHVGIDSMHERAELLGADLTISRSRPTGTTVSVRISLPSQYLRSTAQPSP